MLPIPIEYLLALVITSVVAAFFVVAAISVWPSVVPCPPEETVCDADVLFSRALGATLGVVIIPALFGYLIYYLVTKGRRIKREREYGIPVTPVKPPESKLKLFVGDRWLKEVLIVLGLNYGVIGLAVASLPSYFALPVTLGIISLAIILIHKKTWIFNGRNWGRELCMILVLSIIFNIALRDLLGYPYSIPAEAGGVILSVWLIRKNAMRNQSWQQTINRQP